MKLGGELHGRVFTTISLCVAIGVSAGCGSVTTRTGTIDTSSAPGKAKGIFYYLPKTLVRIKGTVTNSVYTVTLSSEYVADGSARYFLETKDNVLYEDDSTLEVDAKGLLTTVDITAEDKTGAIVADLAAIASKAMTFGAGAGAARNASGEILPFDFTFELTEFTKVQARLQTIGLEASLEKSISTEAKISAFNFPTRANGVPESAKGVVFRAGIPYTLIVSDKPFQERVAAKALSDMAQLIANKKKDIETAATGDTDVARAQEASLREELKSMENQYAENSKISVFPYNELRSDIIGADVATPVLYPLGRSPFSKTVDTLAFSNGMLTKVHNKHPSVILGFLQIPKQILDTISPLPLELKQTQITNIKASRELDSLLTPQENAVEQ